MYKILIISDLECPNSNQFLRDLEFMIALSKISKVTCLTSVPKDLPIESINLHQLSSQTLRYHYIVILNPHAIIDCLEIDVLRDIMGKNRTWPRIIVKTASPLWYNEPRIKEVIDRYYLMTSQNWAKTFVDKLCIQNDAMQRQVKGIIPADKIILSSVAIKLDPLDPSIPNPYDPNKGYLVDDFSDLTPGKALTPVPFIGQSKHLLRLNKRIILYTGSVLGDSGKVFCMMAEIMTTLGENYELHLFLNDFLLPHNQKLCRGNDPKSLDRLRQTTFAKLSNVIVHHNYPYTEKYPYLFYANCAIDFAPLRKGSQRQEHVKLLEYCSVGLPVVYEASIPNAKMIEHHGIAVAHDSDAQTFANAVKLAIDMPRDLDKAREPLSAHTVERRTHDFLEEIIKY